MADINMTPKETFAKKPRGSALPTPEKKLGWITDEPRWRHVFGYKLIEFDDQCLAFNNRQLRGYLKQGEKALKTWCRQQPDTCVVAANGPSLKGVDWERFSSLPVFGSNYAFLDPELASRIDLLCVTNPWVAAQAQKAFQSWPKTLVMPAYLAYWIPPTDNHLLLNFSFTDTPVGSLGAPFSTRSTVSYFALQLAISLGFRNIILVGFDHNYSQPTRSAEGALIYQDSPDPNHFSQAYFQNKIWQAADTTKMSYVYALLAEVAAQQDVSIINCTAGSKLDIFPKMSVDAALTECSSHVVHDMPDKDGDAMLRVMRLAQRMRDQLSGWEVCGVSLLALVSSFFVWSVLSTSIALVGTLFFWASLALTMIGVVNKRDQVATVRELHTQAFLRLKRSADERWEGNGQ